MTYSPSASFAYETSVHASNPPTTFPTHFHSMPCIRPADATFYVPRSALKYLYG